MIYYFLYESAFKASHIVLWMISFSVKYLQDPFQPLYVCRDTVLAKIILRSSLFIGKDVSMYLSLLGLQK